MPPEGAGSPWVGWVIFAGAALVVFGALTTVRALLTLYRDMDPAGNRPLAVDLSAWSLLLVVAFGLGLGVAGVGVLAGQTWARVVGVVMAVLVAAANLAVFPAYPVLSVLTIAVAVVGVAALVTHGRDLNAVRVDRDAVRVDRGDQREDQQPPDRRPADQSER